MRKSLLILLLIIGLGAALRLNGIVERDYWYDEAFTGITVRQPVGEMLDIVANDVHPPLYYLLLKAWMVFGDGPLELRLFSAFFGVATVVIAYVAVREWDRRRRDWPAVFAASLVAINPFLIGYSQEARMYSLLGFTILLAAYLLSLSWRKDNIRTRMAYGVAIAAVCLTHYLGALFVVVLFLADAYIFFRDYRDDAGRWFFSAYGVAFLAGIAWMPAFFKQFASHGSLGWVPDRPLSDLLVSLYTFFFGAAVGEAGIPPALVFRVTWLNETVVSIALLALVLGLIAALVIRKQWDRTTGLIVSLATLPLLMTWFMQSGGVYLYVERYLIGIAVFLLLFVVVALSRLVAAPFATVPAALYLLLVILIQPWPRNTTFPELVQIISPALPATVVFTDAFGFTVGRYYLGEPSLGTLHFYNIANPTTPFVGWATVPEGQQVFSLPEYPHVLVTDHPEAFANYQVIDSVNGYTVMQSL